MKEILFNGNKVRVCETPADVDELLYGVPQFMPGGSNITAVWEVIPIEPIPIETIVWCEREE